MRILITDKIHPSGLALLREYFEVDESENLAPEGLLVAISDYDVLVGRSKTAISKPLIAAGKKLKAIGRAGIGIDNIDIDAATEARIPIFNAPTGNVRAVAEHTIGLMVTIVRQIPRATEGMKAGRWEKNLLMGRELNGKVLGIVGIGKIGKVVADIARCMGMRVLAYDPYVAAYPGVSFVSLEDLLGASDVVSLHAPLTEETRNFIDRQKLTLIKKGAFFVNTARGELIDEEAFFDALEAGYIAGAALDVFSKEPPQNPRMSKLENLVLTPHIAGLTEESQERTALEVAGSLTGYLLHGETKNVVNPAALRK